MHFKCVKDATTKRRTVEWTMCVRLADFKWLIDDITQFARVVRCDGPRCTAGIVRPTANLPPPILTVDWPHFEASTALLPLSLSLSTVWPPFSLVLWFLLLLPLKLYHFMTWNNAGAKVMSAFNAIIKMALLVKVQQKWQQFWWNLFCTSLFWLKKETPKGFLALKQRGYRRTTFLVQPNYPSCVPFGVSRKQKSKTHYTKGEWEREREQAPCMASFLVALLGAFWHHSVCVYVWERGEKVSSIRLRGWQNYCPPVVRRGLKWGKRNKEEKVQEEGDDDAEEAFHYYFFFFLEKFYSQKSLRCDDKSTCQTFNLVQK